VRDREESSFFEKKEAKNLLSVCCPAFIRTAGASSYEQKFFASFFQKRSLPS